MTTHSSLFRLRASTRGGPEPTVGPLRPARTGSLAVRVARAPAAWLAVIVGLSTILGLSIVLGVPAPWILPDEILYAELARSVADGALPSVRGVTTLGWGVVYPVLVAPAWAAFDDPVSAYHAALAINALVMSSAAVPAYLLARLFVARRLSLVVAAMTVLVPSMAYTGVVMTENAFYPLFLWTMLAIARAVRRPTAGGQLLVLAGIGVLVSTRIQGAALAAAYLAAVALYGVSAPPGRRGAYLRRFAPTFAVVSALAVAALAVLVVRGLGSREGTFDALRPLEVPEWLAYLAGGLVLYAALIPAAASAVAIGRGLRSRASEPERLFAAVALPTIATLLVTVSFVSASIDVDGTQNLNERYVFYVVPLLFLGLAIWIEAGLPRPRPWAWIAVLACSVLAVSVPVDRLEYNAGFQAVALLPWLRLPVTGMGLAACIAVFVVAAGAVFLRGRPSIAGRLWLATGAWLALLGAVTVAQNATPAAYFSQSDTNRAATWIDDRVPSGSRVVVVLDQRVEPAEPDLAHYSLLVAEFFNETVTDVYRTGTPTYYENVLPARRATLAPGGWLVDADGNPIDARYVVATCRARIDGEVLERSRGGEIQLVAAQTPLRLAGDARGAGSRRGGC